MPTGVPIADVRPRLFDAALRVLGRDGPSALTSRAVTQQAGLAKGILYQHFADFETFLALLSLSRLERLDECAAQLRRRAGEGDVAVNLAAALSDALDPDSLAVVTLILSRHGLLARMRVTTPTGIPLLSEAARMVAGYLTAEQGLGRVAARIDVDAIAVSIVGAAHLTLAGCEAPDSDAMITLVQRLVAARDPSRTPRRTG